MTRGETRERLGWGMAGPVIGLGPCLPQPPLCSLGRFNQKRGPRPGPALVRAHDEYGDTEDRESLSNLQAPATPPRDVERPLEDRRRPARRSEKAQNDAHRREVILN